MPLTENYDIQRIKADLAKAKQRLTEMQAGEHVHTDSGMPREMAVKAWENSMGALYTTIRKLEGEYVTAMVNASIWSNGEIIQRMEQK